MQVQKTDVGIAFFSNTCARLEVMDFSLPVVRGYRSLVYAKSYEQSLRYAAESFIQYESLFSRFIE